MSGRRRAAAIVLLVAWLVGAGCALAPQGARPDRADFSIEQEGSSVFRPESMRVHPLTRATRGGTPATLVIDAHFELFDAWGHPTKGLGVLRVELDDAGGEGIGLPGEGGPVRAEVDLTDPQTNSSRYYDSATRTYRMFLESPRAPSVRRLRLRATFLTIDGRRLSDAYTLSVPGSPRPADEGAPTPPPGEDENAPPVLMRRGEG